MANTSAVAGAVKWIASLVEEAKYLHGVEGNVRDLQNDLICMQELVQQVDSNPELQKEESQLYIFTQKIRELAYRAEDAIDTYIVNLESKIHRKNLILKLVNITSHGYPIHMLIMEIEAIQEEIRKAKDRFQTFGIIPNTSRELHPSTIPENYIHLDDEVIVGIHDDINQLVHRLTDPDDVFKVLAIVGTGGAGKSTLATQIYRHQHVTSWFSVKAFIYVSRQWSSTNLLGRIYKQVKGRDNEKASSESEILQEVYEFLKDKKWLIILDDIWDKDAWDVIYPLLPRTRGCRVIITTRKEEIPLHADNECIVHRPKLLTEDQKWELFSKFAMEGRTHIDKNVEFEILGRQVLGKCKGLPLAVATLAGILRTKKELYQWEDISKACTENILKGKSHKYGVVEDMLELSYLDLPTYLKPCFLYLAMIPEDWDIRVKMLIQMWIAEGFITDELRTAHGTLEDAAVRVLDELAQRCIIQVTSRDDEGHIWEFRLHDLMREICIKKSKEYQFIGIVSSTYLDVRGSSQPRRIATFFSREYFLEENDHLRTLICFGVKRSWSSRVVVRELESIDNKFKLLRVLCICGLEGIVALPEQIGNLTHLRKLGIYNVFIEKFPKSIRNLRNLLYLKCPSFFFGAIPKDLVGNMMNLRGLSLRNNINSGSFDSLGLSCSKNLQSLSCSAGKWMIKDLHALSLTVQHLEILEIAKMAELEAIYLCPGILEDRLRTLMCTLYPRFFELEFDSYNLYPRSDELIFDLQKLRHCTTLWGLELEIPLANSGVGTIQFPSNLVKLSLSHSKIEERDDLIKVLGELCKLKFLTLKFNAYLGTKLSCTGSDFPQLRELELKALDNLEEWQIEQGAMGRLTKVTISRCSRLKTLPETLKELVIR